MPPLRKSTEWGVSLAEALVAVAILGFVGVVMVADLWSLVQYNNLARINLNSESRARYELEYVKSVSENWTNIPTPTAQGWYYVIPTGPYPLWNTQHSSLPSGYSGYVVTVRGTFVYGTDASIQQVTATVTYNNNQEAQIAEYITKKK
jgi:hypothetical protein